MIYPLDMVTFKSYDSYDSLPESILTVIHSETQIIHTILQSYPNLASNQFPVGGGLFGDFFWVSYFFRIPVPLYLQHLETI